MMVLFDTYGGVFGVDKAFVTEIEGSNRIVPLPTQPSTADTPIDVSQQPAISVAAPQQSETKDVKDQKSTPASTPKKPIKKDENILKEYNELLKRSNGLDDLPKHEIQALGDDIYSFRRKVGSPALAEAHKEEIDAMASLLPTIYSYLKATYP